MKTLVDLGIYTKENNPFAGNKLLSLKDTFIFPKQGKIRFQVQLDKNGQVHDIVQTYAQVIKDGGKKTIKVSTGERPRRLFERIHGRPFENASDWIFAEIENILAKEECE